MTETGRRDALSDRLLTATGEAVLDPSTESHIIMRAVPTV
ncbi:uncharacterized protein Nmag_2254 [Natrialba magadii ATCC 43099]|uniref:Uncharacterized protein n=1 Tax=Natrialba magadii (strain ATCC 43099 / DSM 3394 / CCM 3739 / CIP 104546 / IAM 13178 / JCM 8861 / NBRC 102185 / NCIMB 2190 / MS3) TaxID=547559 RepID=D3SWT7_NATMM|nr:uncharacterized protein Nmag_2254 [Natrialba magadii ATCC 43099]ELY30105.1 hypothetical protein C500_09134 [Natrialba magadii ATCC 43099]